MIERSKAIFQYREFGALHRPQPRDIAQSIAAAGAASGGGHLANSCAYDVLAQAYSGTGYHGKASQMAEKAISSTTIGMRTARNWKKRRGGYCRLDPIHLTTFVWLLYLRIN